MGLAALGRQDDGMRFPVCEGGVVLGRSEFLFGVEGIGEEAGARGVAFY